MIIHCIQTDVARRGPAAGPQDCDAPDALYGRRVEADRSWTVYHVFTGVPARVGARTMIRLSRDDATESMLSLNRRNARRRKERGAFSCATLSC